MTVEDRTAAALRITDALLQVAAERGLDAASVREVALAAGVAIGTVQHHFPTKAAMLAAAMARVSEAVSARIDALEPSGSVRAATRLALLELLPLDARRVAEVRVWQAFVLRAAYEPALRAVAEQTADRVLTGLTGAIRAGQAAGEVPRSRDAGVEASLLMAVVDGLTLEAAGALDELSRQWVLPLLDLALDRVFTRIVGPSS